MPNPATKPTPKPAAPNTPAARTRTAPPPARTAVAPATPAALPDALQRAVDAAAVKAVEAGFASRPTPAPVQGPVTSGAKDLQMDPPTGCEAQARMGVRLKALYVQSAERLNIAHRPGIEKLKSYVERCKSVGIFAGIFEQGGALYSRETRSEEVIELLRADAILLSAGARTVSGYGGKFTVGRINQGPTVFWVGEGQPPAKSDMKTGAVELGAHKAMALVPISNDTMRLGNSTAAADVGREVSQAMALEVDLAGLYGKGAKKPTGIFELVPNGNKAAITGTTIEQIRNDLKMKLIKPVTKSKLKLAGNQAFYFMDSSNHLYLSELRDSAGYIFPGLSDFENPRLNGFPVKVTESIADLGHIGFGLASQLYYGEASELEATVGEASGDFESDQMTLRMVWEGDWALRHRQSFAFLTGATYGS
ncbi:MULTISPECIES: phage major capsid protein [unclassified Corallococcus]|uniref:phage major capsid protein n=1 Tax=unclassified Corallococcus TaxID=2685029 RepID=UPI001A8E4E41|nr:MULTISPECIES: phage major capsid protein [unclassified Corallococcus]MBN9687128.1 phage major capsid protein [Corallococcus sp. NCSPR001]WAS89044.1 phage major capsid protein [Corallococcus sp. NCRR]